MYVRNDAMCKPFWPTTNHINKQIDDFSLRFALIMFPPLRQHPDLARVLVHADNLVPELRKTNARHKADIGRSDHRGFHINSHFRTSGRRELIEIYR